MTILSKQDLLEVSIKSLVADYDYETVTNLYQPIVGFEATSLYFTLLMEAKNQKTTGSATHEEICLRMGIAPGNFEKARKRLEAIGLLKTYARETETTSIYHYEIYAPAAPNQFFENAVLYGMLIQCVGEQLAKKLKSLYPITNNSKYGTDISAKFKEVYHPELDSGSFSKAIEDKDKAAGRNIGKVNGNFLFEDFFKFLKQNSQIKEDAFLKSDLKEIYRLATLYDVDEETAARIVASIYDPSLSKGNRINFDNLARLFRSEIDYATKTKRTIKNSKPNLNDGTTALASKVNLMETVSPTKFLKLLQNGTTPAQADLRIIDSLSKKFDLNNAVINAIIDYVLTMCDNVLSKYYAEKVAASIAREGITTAIDAMNYLLKVNNKKKNNVVNKEEDATVKEDKKQVSNNTQLSEDDDAGWEDLLDELDQGGSDGKA